MAKKIFIYSLLFMLSSTAAMAINKNLFSQDKVMGISTSINLENPEEYSLVFASLPAQTSQVQASVKTADARPEIIRQYLQKYDSPLVPHADLLVQIADKYDFDYRWMVAIAQQESNLCKKIPYESYNCWGWGIYGDKVTRFDSYEQAITKIAPQFKKIFLKGLHDEDPHQVMETYTPPSQGSWARGVMQFFNELE
ncbi:hypothetical protein KJ953_04460 [Patescibacteria group bacterium]|nr:hypothetical protein [Patescibacteria group bacterium]MBU1256206.1 hypothetical protein [Patescibacteria group bacterium]MBU1457807.1 hypothetical protein [Patescibacteria group bacterium]